MPEYDNTNSGALFKNEKKTKETQPDYTGKINVDGKEKSLSAWKKESKSGKVFLSIKISEPWNGGGNSSNYGSNSNNGDNSIDDIPF